MDKIEIPAFLAQAGGLKLRDPDRRRLRRHIFHLYKNFFGTSDVAIDILLVPKGELPFIERSQMMQEIMSIECDDALFVFLKRHWVELEARFGEIDPYDITRFGADELEILRRSFIEALRDAEQRPDTWEEVVSETIEHTQSKKWARKRDLISEIKVLIAAADRGLEEGKELLFFGD